MEKKTITELLALPDAEQKVIDKDLLKAIAADTVQVLAENRKRRRR